MSTSVCLVFGDPSGVPGKDVGETEGAPTARRCIFFYYSPLELYNIFWNAIVVMPECRTGSYLCWLTVGGCNAGFIKAVSAGVHFCIAAHRELCCWLLRTVLFHFSFQAVLWNSVFQLIFLQQWFFFPLEGKPQAAWIAELCGTDDTTLCVYTVMDNWYILFLLVLLGALSWSI